MVIKLDPLMEMSNQMMRIRGELMEQAEELTRVFRRLEQLSGTEEVLRQLRKDQQNLEQQAWYAYQQARALEQIVRWYGSCERSVQAEYEDTSIRYPRNPGTVVNLSAVTEFLK